MDNVLATCDGPVLAQYRLPMYGTAGTSHYLSDAGPISAC